jgi:hypothetical protein
MGDGEVDEKKEGPIMTVEEEVKRRQSREKAFGSLMEGLKGLE